MDIAGNRGVADQRGGERRGYLRQRQRPRRQSRRTRVTKGVAGDGRSDPLSQNQESNDGEHAATEGSRRPATSPVPEF